jgi:hypothetical protein
MPAKLKRGVVKSLGNTRLLKLVVPETPAYAELQHSDCLIDRAGR